jgi:hypothetical protein
MSYYGTTPCATRGRELSALAGAFAHTHGGDLVFRRRELLRTRPMPGRARAY